MEVASPGQGANGYPPKPDSKPAIDEAAVIRYLTDLLELTLGATEDDLYAGSNLLSESKKSDTIQRCIRFASGSQVALYVQKDVLHSHIPNGSQNGHNEQGK